jgi:hypothetical protein
MVGTGTEFADYNAVLKTYYNGQQIQDLTNTDNPLFAMIGREQLRGNAMPLPVINTYGQGVSASYATAKTNQTNGKTLQFSLAAATLYQIVDIDRLTWKSSLGQGASFLDYMKFKIDGGLQGMGNAMSAYCYGSGTGVLAQSNGMSTGVITLLDPDSVAFFEIGQVLEATTTNDSSSNANKRAAKGFVISVDYNAGTITVSATAGGAAGNPASWSTGAAGDFLGLQDTLNAVPSGLQGWFPLTAPGSSDSFKGVNRSVDPARLSGSRYDGSSVTAEEAILNGSTIGGRLGAKPDVGVVSTDVFNQLIKIQQGRIVYVDAQVGQVGFEGIKVHGNKGPIRVFQDRNCPQQLGWLLSSKNLAVYSVGPAPELQVDEFGQLLRRADADAYQAVVSSYWEIGCNSPVGNVALKFPTQ